MGGQESAEPIGGESGGISAPPAAHTAGGAVGAEGGGGRQRQYLAAKRPGCVQDIKKRRERERRSNLIY